MKLSDVKGGCHEYSISITVSVIIVFDKTLLEDIKISARQTKRVDGDNLIKM